MKAKTKTKLNFKQKLGVSIFLNSVPQIIDVWKKSPQYPETPFDVFLMDIYNQHNNQKKGD